MINYNKTSRAAIFQKKIANLISNFDIEDFKKVKVYNGDSTLPIMNLIDEYYSKTINNNLFNQKIWDKIIYEPLKEIFESKDELLTGYRTPIDFLSGDKYNAVISLSKILFTDKNKLKSKKDFEKIEVDFGDLYLYFYTIFNNFFETSAEVDKIMDDFGSLDQLNSSNKLKNPKLEFSNTLKKHTKFYDVLSALYGFTNPYNFGFEFSICFDIENNNFNIISSDKFSEELHGIYGLETNKSFNFIEFFIEDYYKNLNSQGLENKEYLNNPSINELLLNSFKEIIESWNSDFNEKLLKSEYSENGNFLSVYYKNFELPTEIMSEDKLSKFLKKNYGDIIDFISTVKSKEEKERIINQIILLSNS